VRAADPVPKQLTSTMSKLPLQHSGHHGMQPWAVRENYTAYKSKFGPDYKIQPNFHGISLGRAARFTKTAGFFGAATGIFALFFFAGVPRVRTDILEKVPILGSYFHHEIPPEDNPF